MGIKSFAALQIARFRARQIQQESKRACFWQQKTFGQLLAKAQHTQFGKDHHFSDIRTHADFISAVPVRSYEAAKPYFDRIYQGEPDVSWPGKPIYLAKTSGTTSGAKYIPLTKVSIRNQIAAARDALLLYAAETGNASFFDGKMMFLSGSPEIEMNNHGLKVGRLSGIVNHFVPGVLLSNRVPTYETNCIEDWEDKVKAIASEVHDKDLRLISGIPPWVQMFFEELEASHGKSPLGAWPNLSIFVQGGVDFNPYRPIFDKYLGDSVDMVEVYPASEGFFAIQNSQADDGLLLLPRNGVFYEFIPLNQYGSENAPRLGLEEVELGEQYAMIISTNAGLWAYDIGDTVKFVSLDPYKIRVSGRVKHFLSAFGEHVISEEVNFAIMEAVKQAGGEFQEFTVAPSIQKDKGDSCHEWLIEFVNRPDDLAYFSEVLDQKLQAKNPYYQDLRSGNILQRAKITPLKVGASREYMKSVGKLGGQNKFPRLSNDRKLADALAPYIL